MCLENKPEPVEMMSVFCLQLRKEVLLAYQQLRMVCDRLRHSRGDSISSDMESMPSEDISPSKLKVCKIGLIVIVKFILIYDIFCHFM
jgi:hypothetical protein